MNNDKLINEVNKISGITEQLDDIEQKKANGNEVVKKGCGTLSDFDEDTRRAIQGMDSGQINAVLGEGNVQYNNTTFFRNEHINLVDGSKLTGGYLVSGVVSSSPSHTVSDFIKVTKGEVYVKNGAWESAYYDNDKKFISVLSGNKFTIPTGVGYIRCTYVDTVENARTKFMVVKADVLPTNFIPYDKMKFTITGGELANEISNIAKDTILNSDFNELLPNESVSINKTDFFKINNINLIPKDCIFTKGYVQDNGTVSGGVVYTTDFIKVNPSTIYATNGGGWNSGFYTKDKVLISIFIGGRFTTPSNCEYVRISGYIDENKNIAMLCLGGDLPPTYIENNPYNIVFTNSELKKCFVKYMSPLYGLKWNVLGDSITSPDYVKATYHQVIAKKYDMVVNNYGVSGTSITATEGQGTKAMCKRYIDMNDDADIITVMAGTNDRGSTIGTMSDRVETTLYGACHILFKGLLEKYPAKRIGVILPFRYSDINYNDDNMYNVIKTITEVAHYYSLPVLDLYHELGIIANLTPELSDLYTVDTLHLSEVGHSVVARRVENFILSL